jgi:repressor LexA
MADQDLVGGQMGSKMVVVPDEKYTNTLRFIIDFIEQNGYGPTLREIGDGLGLRAVSAVRNRVEKLEAMGYVTRVPDKARTIRVVYRGEANGS